MRRKLYVLLTIITMVATLSNAIGLSSVVSAAPSKHGVHVCDTNVPSSWARCNAAILTGSDGVTPLVSATPSGYGPADFRAAYKARGTAVTHIAIVTAYDAPTIAQDLSNYSSVFGLPAPTTCTASYKAGCFEKLSQTGGIDYPAVSSSWAVEASLDVETAHGICPECQISLIEAKTSAMNNLVAAVDMAVARGARIISNSYGGAEMSHEADYDSHYRHAGITAVVSSGDSGYGTSYPAASTAVVAVGGTSLQMRGSHVLSEAAWEGSGSGCSAYEHKPIWQHDSKCRMRTIADVSADADPATGAAIYDSYPTKGHSGWFTVGGTSLAAPLVAGILAASGRGSQVADLYASNSYRDITSGVNGSCGSYYCQAQAGYDGPTGLGVLTNY